MLDFTIQAYNVILVEAAYPQWGGAWCFDVFIDAVI